MRWMRNDNREVRVSTHVALGPLLRQRVGGVPWRSRGCRPRLKGAIAASLDLHPVILGLDGASSVGYGPSCPTTWSAKLGPSISLRVTERTVGGCRPAHPRASSHGRRARARQGDPLRGRACGPTLTRPARGGVLKGSGRGASLVPKFDAPPAGRTQGCRWESEARPRGRRRAGPPTFHLPPSSSDLIRGSSGVRRRRSAAGRGGSRRPALGSSARATKERARRRGGRSIPARSRGA